MGLFSKLFGSYSDRELKKINPIVEKIEKLEPRFAAMEDAELQAMTPALKARLAAGETLDDILPEAFAAVREAAWRVLGMKPFHVQLIGGVVLHQGRIAEMKTGEGKTLVAVLPAYLNALAGKGVHIVTVNDYLARRDSEWMGKVHRFMGLSVGLIVHDLTPEQRRAAYACDITYGTNNEMGFDYLRDNMALYKEQMVQRGHVFAIVDEVDSILIDEARTPLIISGQGDESTDLYRQADDFVRSLKKVVYASVDEKQEESEELDADYVVDEKARSATLTARGIARAERAFGLENYADLENATLTHHINQALKAHGIMKRDIDYIIKDGEIIIVDEFTGRLMFGRRYSEGLHQAIEAKEHVDVQKENKTLATITFQNFFRLYDKLSGMTGTAATEAEEFGAIYKLDIVEIPTNKPVIRVDHPDVVFKNEAGKNRAILQQIAACHEKGQPVLVGTVSIEKSEALSKLLTARKIPHTVLNAKYHEKEAEIVAQAGKFGAVTIATNMAGRGTDIVLGGNADFLARKQLEKDGFLPEVIAEVVGSGEALSNNEAARAALEAREAEDAGARSFGEEELADVGAARRRYLALRAAFKKQTDEEAKKVRAAGGLFILGTERHESRRIDNQLRGRSGRQGDPGESCFYLAMTDDVLRLFGGERMQNLMETLKIDEDTPIDARILSNGIEQAQRTVESRNFQVRKTVLEYDDVMNQQREIIYGERRKVLDGEDVHAQIMGMIREYVSNRVTEGLGGVPAEDEETLARALQPFEKLFLPAGTLTMASFGGRRVNADKLTETVYEIAEKVYAERERAFGAAPDGKPFLREIERVVMLRVVDEYWMEHIDAMDELKRGIGLRGYGNVKPVDAYKQEGYDMFEAMVTGIREETVRRLFLQPVRPVVRIERKAVAKNVAANVGGEPVKKKPVRKAAKPGRNDPCPCGKMKADGSRRLKYKECCGRNE